jgi:tetratricopeptide (TPR) repeat protein
MTVARKSELHSGVNGQAIRSYDRAVTEFAAQRPFLAHVHEALRHDAHMTAAHALSGIAHALIGRNHGTAIARAAVSSTRSALAAAGGGTPHERALSLALEAASFGRFKRAAFHLEQHLETNPTDLLAIKLAHALRFMTGQPHNMLRTTAAVLQSWDKSMSGYGFVLGCRAFALEETGNLTEAEACGRRAVAFQPDDAWGLHAVAHVLEMSGRTDEGRSWLEAAQCQFRACGVFGQHLVWHLALFHLSDGDRDHALSLYDAAIRPSRDGDFRDIANAVSLLWRLEQEGVDVGHRWDGLHEIAHERRLDCTYAFASLHYLLALIAAGDRTAARECVEAMRKRSRGDADDQSPVFARVGADLGEALLSAPRSGNLERLAQGLPELGGSRAQQDVFLRSLLMLALRDNDTGTLQALSAVRLQQRTEDRFQRLVTRRTNTTRRTTFVTTLAEMDHHP